MNQLEDKGDYGQHEKDEEQNLSNPGGGPGDATEAEDGGNQRDDEEYNGEFQHDESGGDVRGILETCIGQPQNGAAGLAQTGADDAICVGPSAADRSDEQIGDVLMTPVK